MGASIRDVVKPVTRSGARRSTRDSLRAWMAIAATVAVAWIAGMLFWGSVPSSFNSGNGEIPPDLLNDAAAGVALTALAGVVRGLRDDALVRRGVAVAIAAGWSAWAFMAAFGGMCLEPTDMCAISTSAHLVHLAIPFAAISLGALGDLTIRVRQRH